MRVHRHCRWSRTAPLAALSLAGCAVVPTQSMIHPAGPAAADIATLWWVMFWAFATVFVLVVALLGWAIVRGPGQPREPAGNHEPPSELLPPLGRSGFIVAGGVILPVAVLTPIFLYSLSASATLHRKEPGPTIRVIGHMWWWEVRYPDQGLVAANELHIPAGQPVRLEMTSADVIHSFWVPRLHGKRDLIPGISTTFWIEASEPGVYRGVCAEYCGTQHANMAFDVVAHAPEEFAAWLAAPARRGPENAAEQPGLAVFRRAGCGQCHAIRGTPAVGTAGPDLTDFGSRRTIAAGMLPNTRGNLAGWIANPQAIKPGSKMPRTYLDADELWTLVLYLESLQ